MRSLNQPVRRTFAGLAVVVMCAVPAMTSSAQPGQSRGKAVAAKTPSRGAAAKGKGRCEVGQVPKWSGRRWVCADDLVGGASGGGSGPSVLDANGNTIGPAFGTALTSGTTMPTLLFSASDSPKPFLLTVDEGGFVSDGRLLVQTTNELTTCAASCGPDLECIASCVAATPACDVSNVFLQPPAPVSPLFRAGAVVGSTPAAAELWVATSATLTPIGECMNAGIPACITAVYHPADNSCTVDFAIGDPESAQKMAYPATPLGNLHALHPPPYTLRQP